jgi:hypothetical protein
MTTDDRYDDLDDDELVSAWIDGELPPEVAARVAADPALTGRADELRAAAAAVAEAVVPPSGAVDDAVGRALGAGPAVVPLRRRPANAPRWIAAAAAAVLVVVLAAIGIRNIDTTSDKSSSASAASTTTGAQNDAATGRFGADASGDATTGGAGASASAPPVDLGDVDDPDTLRQRLERFATATPTERSAQNVTPKASQPTGPCGTEAAREAHRDGVERTLALEASLRYQGVPAVVYVYGPAGTAPGVIVVADTSSCAIRYSGSR